MQLKWRVVHRATFAGDFHFLLDKGRIGSFPNCPRPSENGTNLSKDSGYPWQEKKVTKSAKSKDSHEVFIPGKWQEIACLDPVPVTACDSRHV